MMDYPWRISVRSTVFVIGFVAGFALPLNCPAQTQSGPQILAAAGIGEDLLAEVRNGTLQAFVEEEHELFTRLAKAMIGFESRPPAAEPQPFDLLSALQHPEAYKGSFVQAQGTVRRVTPIQITSPRLKQQLGQAEYYQVDLFVTTHSTNFQLQDDQGQVVIGGTYGITLILFELPAVFRQIKHVTVSVPGFYLKNWSHKTVDTREVSDELRRPNPVVFGIGSMTRSVDLQAGQRGIDSVIAWFWGGLIVLLAGLGGWQWRTARRRKQRKGDLSVAVDFSDLE